MTVEEIANVAYSKAIEVDPDITILVIPNLVNGDDKDKYDFDNYEDKRYDNVTIYSKFPEIDNSGNHYQSINQYKSKFINCPIMMQIYFR